MACFLLMQQMNSIEVDLGLCTGLIGSPRRASTVLRTDPRVADLQKSPKKWLLGSKQGWTTKQVRDIIFRECGVRYHYTHVYRILHKWGFKQKIKKSAHQYSLK
ncbi:MAG: winged helix-turn-helix domain-containing protein [Candidatus Nitrosopolaris sp.]